MTTMRDPNERNRAIIDEFHSNGGKVPSHFGGAKILLLTHTGAKSGQKRTNPLMYLQDGNRFLIFATKGGSPTNPDWYHNLVAHADVTVEVGTESFQARAVVVTGPERDRLYARQVQAYPQFGDYEKRTTRKIPVVALERKA